VEKRLEANSSQADEAQKNFLKAIEMVVSAKNKPVIVYITYPWYDCLPGWTSYHCSGIPSSYSKIVYTLFELQSSFW
jgi:hypothetical protein